MTTPQGMPHGGSFEPYIQGPQQNQVARHVDPWQMPPSVEDGFATVNGQIQYVAPAPQTMNANMYGQQTPFPQAPQAMNANMYGQQMPFPQAPQAMNANMYGQQTPVSQAPQTMNANMYGQQPPFPQVPQTMNANMYGQQTPVPQAPSQGRDPLFRASFMGSDQQWYQVSATVGQGAAVVQPPLQPQAIYNSSWSQPGAFNTWASANASAVAPQLAAFPEQYQEEADTSRDFLLQYVQPGLAGLMDGSVSTLAPIFSVAFATHQSFTTFLVGMASALGAGISMTFAEALSDDGEQTGRGKPFLRGGVTGLMTFLSGAGHALPFLITNLQVALMAAYAVVAIELLIISAIRHKFFGTSWGLSIVQVVGGGALVFLAALFLGNA